MPRRKDSDDECEIDVALQDVFYYEPMSAGKKRRKLQKVTLPTTIPSNTQLHQQISSQTPWSSMPGDNSHFLHLDDHDAPRQVEVLPVKGKVRGGQLPDVPLAI